MAHDEVVETGMLGKALVEGLYEPQAKYTDEEFRRILYGSEPRYLYESPKGDGGNVPTIDGSQPRLMTFVIFCEILIRPSSIRTVCAV